MFKKLLFTGWTLLLLTACGTSTTEENTSQANQAAMKNESVTSNNTNNNAAAVKDSNTSTANNSTQNTVTAADIANPPVSLTEAVKIFKEVHPDAKVESVDLDTDDGRLHYDFEGFDASHEYEAEIDAATGEIRENEVDPDREDDEFLDFAAIISPAKAIEIASTRTEVKGLSPTGWSLEADDGKQKYTVEYDKNNVADDDNIDIKINAVTEEILEVNID